MKIITSRSQSKILCLVQISIGLKFAQGICFCSYVNPLTAQSESLMSAFSLRAPRLPDSPTLITFHFEALVVFSFGHSAQMCFMCKILHIGQLKG